MKIKTITCHDVYNAGASLQAYALVTYLRNLGHDAEIIDYKPDYLNRHYRLGGVGNSRYDKPIVKQAYLLANLPGRLRARCGMRKKRFDAFREAYLPLTKRYASFEQLKNEPPVADVYFAGSDQIWNTQFPNGRDPAFYLSFASEGSVRASYAASFAASHADEAWAERQAAWITGLDYVSVREPSGVDILRGLGIEGQAVLDPVFLLPAETWRTLAIMPEEDAPYMLVYDFDGSGEIERAAKELAEKNGWQIRSLQKLPYADRCDTETGPREFLGLIAGAQCVLSNSFHATAFSLIFQRPFMTFDRKENLNARMRDLVRLAGLESHNGAEEPIDWAAVQIRLDREIAASKAYIDEVLKEKQE